MRNEFDGGIDGGIGLMNSGALQVQGLKGCEAIRITLS